MGSLAGWVGLGVGESGVRAERGGAGGGGGGGVGDLM